MKPTYLLQKGLNRRQGQVQMTETIAVIFIFFILIILGTVFYTKFQQVSFQEKGEELLAAKALDTTMKVLFLPELACSKGSAELEDFCFDLMKVRGVGEIFQRNDDYYFNLFSYSNISIHQLYPLGSPSSGGGSGEVVYTLYERSKLKTLDSGETVPDWTRKEPSFFVITLRDESQREDGEDKYYFGYLEVEVYS